MCKISNKKIKKIIKHTLNKLLFMRRLQDSLQVTLVKWINSVNMERKETTSSCQTGPPVEVQVQQSTYKTFGPKYFLPKEKINARNKQKLKEWLTTDKTNLGLIMGSHQSLTLVLTLCCTCRQALDTLSQLSRQAVYTSGS